MLEFNATFIIAMFSFVVFIFIMNMIFYKPIFSVIKKRNDYIDSNYKTADSYQKQANDYNISRSNEISKVQIECRNKITEFVQNARAELELDMEKIKESNKIVLSEKKDLLLKQNCEIKSKIKDTVVKDLASCIVNKFINDNVEINDMDKEKIDRMFD